ncbi:hypothetical protein B0H17DRAFT_1067944 [Mycena rosella]|uniref:Uncharacterized protein n=1 Tax=Mycena rosella TaxID=1033263 RepID=A0AAD7GCX0_MYCRO|nr:hypothetical protein B0H17DRAFT_1067944 [Mycena rosella]
MHVTAAESAESQILDYPGTSSGPATATTQNGVYMISYEVYRHTRMPTLASRAH